MKNQASVETKIRAPMSLEEKMGRVIENEDGVQYSFKKIKASLPHLANLNPPDFPKPEETSRFFVIKSFNEENVHKSLKYEVWASTQTGNDKLNQAYAETSKLGGHVYLFFSVNASQQFMGVARMTSAVDFTHNFDHWTQKKKFEGFFKLEWVFVKDIPNKYFRKILIPQNESKPVTNSRDTQEIPYPQAAHMIKIYVQFDPQTSILDDFEFYEKRQQDHQMRKLRNQIKKKKQHSKEAKKQHTDSPLKNNSKIKLFSRNQKYNSTSSENEDSQGCSENLHKEFGLFGDFVDPGDEDEEDEEEKKKNEEDDDERPIRIYQCNSQDRSLSPMGVFPQAPMTINRKATLPGVKTATSSQLMSPENKMSVCDGSGYPPVFPNFPMQAQSHALPPSFR